MRLVDCLAAAARTGPGRSPHQMHQMLATSRRGRRSLLRPKPDTKLGARKQAAAGRTKESFASHAVPIRRACNAHPPCPRNAGEVSAGKHMERGSQSPDQTHYAHQGVWKTEPGKRKPYLKSNTAPSHSLRPGRQWLRRHSKRTMVSFARIMAPHRIWTRSHPTKRAQVQSFFSALIDEAAQQSKFSHLDAQ